MAGKKDRCVVCVTTGLTNRQASRLVSEFASAKNKVAPGSRSTAATTDASGVGRLLQRGIRQLPG